jgi:hypothetical protein
MAVNRIRAALGKMLAEVRGQVKAKRSEAGAYRCRGLEWNEAVRVVIEAVDDADVDLLKLVIENVNAIDARPPRELANGEEVRDCHGFVAWIEGLRDGFHALPARMPRALLAAWGTWNRAGAAPVVMLRCNACKLALPNSGDRAEGLYPYWRCCPSCGGTTFEERNLAKEPGHFFRPAD